MKKPAPPGLRPFSRAGRVMSGLSRSSASGFTLIEMLVTLAIGAVLAATALPSFGPMMESMQLISASNVFVSSLQLARSEAIKRNHRVVLCKTADGIFCASTGGWEQGWIIFDDVNNNGTREHTEALLHSQQALAPTLRLVGNLNVASYVSFAPTGGTRLVGGGFQAGTLTLCQYSFAPREARRIVLNAAGRPRVQSATLASCP